MPSLSPSRWHQRLTLRSQRALLRFIREQDAHLQRVIVNAADDAAKIVRDLPGKNVSAIVRRAQYVQRRQALLEIANQMWDDIAIEVVDNIGTSSQMAANANYEMLQVLTRGVGPGRAGIIADSMLASARNTFQDVRSRYLNNIDLSPNVFRRASLMSGKIDSLVDSGIALGKSAREIADDVVGHINPKVMGGQRYAAMRLGRTELNNAYHTTSTRAYEESPYVLGVKWNLSGSHPRPDECNDYASDNHANLGGGVFLPNAIPDKPHPQCFCFLTPITPEPDQFLDDALNGEFTCGRV